MEISPLSLKISPIQFGTDGWRGVLGVDITLERLLVVAKASVEELVYRAPPELKNKKIIIGYDRRFLADQYALAIAAIVRGCDLEPLISETSVTTPACSWAVVQEKALGALVITASHNPPEWLGLKIKGPWGGSVESDFTQAVEQRLVAGSIVNPSQLPVKSLDVRTNHLKGLSQKFDLNSLKNGLQEIGLKIIVDPMHGSAADCMSDLFSESSNELIDEIRTQRDPLFGGAPPEPLERYLSLLIAKVKESNNQGQPAIGIVFDGDGDRLAAIDEKGRYCSTQVLMPLLINHLVRVKRKRGNIVKTVSCSDLISLVAKDLGCDVVELPVGFKYIASEMLTSNVLLGGEESGGLGFGSHLPERDALYAAILLLESIKDSKRLLSDSLDEIQFKFGNSYYERVDLSFTNIAIGKQIENELRNNPPKFVADNIVQEVILKDGVKLRLDVSYWLMFRFSGTEPLLRIYCEAPSKAQMLNSLSWAKDFVNELL